MSEGLTYWLGFTRDGTVRVELNDGTNATFWFEAKPEQIRVLARDLLVAADNCEKRGAHGPN